MADHGESTLEEELAVLQSIYMDEITMKGPEERPDEVMVMLHPYTADDKEQKYVCLQLLIKLTNKYPHAKPSIEIKNPRGISDAQLESILVNLHALTSQKIGHAMLFDLIEYAKECLTDNNRPECDCAICMDHFKPEDDFVRTECYHFFHSICIARYVNKCIDEAAVKDAATEEKESDTSKNMIPCPICRSQVNRDLLKIKDVNFNLAVTEQVVFKPSKKFLLWRKEMKGVYSRQQKRGGIIDIEAEKNKFLIRTKVTKESGDAMLGQNEVAAFLPVFAPELDDNHGIVERSKENRSPVSDRSTGTARGTNYKKHSYRHQDRRQWLNSKDGTQRTYVTKHGSNGRRTQQDFVAPKDTGIRERDKIQKGSYIREDRNDYVSSIGGTERASVTKRGPPGLRNGDTFMAHKDTEIHDREKIQKGSYNREDRNDFVSSKDGTQRTSVTKRGPPGLRNGDTFMAHKDTGIHDRDKIQKGSYIREDRDAYVTSKDGAQRTSVTKRGSYGRRNEEDCVAPKDTGIHDREKIQKESYNREDRNDYVSSKDGTERTSVTKRGPPGLRNGDTFMAHKDTGIHDRDKIQKGSYIREDRNDYVSSKDGTERTSVTKRGPPGLRNGDTFMAHKDTGIHDRDKIQKGSYIREDRDDYVTSKDGTQRTSVTKTGSYGRRNEEDYVAPKDTGIHDRDKNQKGSYIREDRNDYVSSKDGTQRTSVTKRGPPGLRNGDTLMAHKDPGIRDRDKIQKGSCIREDMDDYVTSKDGTQRTSVAKTGSYERGNGYNFVAIKNERNPDKHTAKTSSYIHENTNDLQVSRDGGSERNTQPQENTGDQINRRFHKRPHSRQKASWIGDFVPRNEDQSILENRTRRVGKERNLNSLRTSSKHEHRINESHAELQRETDPGIIIDELKTNLCLEDKKISTTGLKQI